MRRTIQALSIATACLLCLVQPAAAQSDETETYGDLYRDGDYGRFRYEEGAPSVLRSAADQGDVPETAAARNLPIFPGDIVRSRRDQRAEVQLADGTLVRIGESTELTFQSMPRPGASLADNTVLRLAAGTIRVSARLGDREEFRVDTPAGTVYLLGDADVRIDVEGDGSTRVLSRRGVVEVVGEGGSVLVRGGMRSFVTPGAVPSDPRPHNSFSVDAFDRWCDARDDSYRTPDRRDRYQDDDGSADDPELTDEVRPYYQELSGYGRWVWVPDYGRVWYPYDVAAGWRPYVDGYWEYGPGGYFWVSYEPWGWAPYHFGRWTWIPGYGWCWYPGSVFAGAWVSWSWGASFFGWCPLDYWDRPAFISVTTIVYDYYDPACWTFVGYGAIVSKDIRRFVIPIDRIGVSLRGAAVVTRPPRIAPRKLAVSPEWRERVVREAREDRRIRVPAPVAAGRESAPARKFRTIEDRLSRRERGAADDGRAGARPRVGEPGFERPRSEDRRRPVTTPGAGDSGRQAGPRDRGRRVEPPAERGAAPRRDTREPMPRERRTEGSPSTRPRYEERSDPGVGRRPEQGGDARTGSDGRERVRGLYERMSRPRETREAEPQVRRPAPQSPGSTGPEARPAPRTAPKPSPSTPRVEPRPQPRPAPRVEPRPQPRPAPAPHGGGGSGPPTKPKERKR